MFEWMMQMYLFLLNHNQKLRSLSELSFNVIFDGSSSFNDSIFFVSSLNSSLDSWSWLRFLIIKTTINTIEMISTTNITAKIIAINLTLDFLFGVSSIVDMFIIFFAVENSFVLISVEKKATVVFRWCAFWKIRWCTFLFIR